MMDPFLLYSLTGVGLLVVGLHGLIARPHLLRKLIALNVMGGGAFMLLVAVAYRNAGEAPDAVPHAMVLTGIVVAVSATAFALSLIRRLHAETGRVTLDDDDDEDDEAAGAVRRSGAGDPPAGDATR
jgi:multicomponent Na+:H+ antiporter subunit C